MGIHENNTTRNSIIEVAVALYKTFGVNGVTVKSICEQAHVTRNAFYYYFKVREELYDAIGDHLAVKAKEDVIVNFAQAPYYPQIWSIYRPYLEYQLSYGPDIMNHCCFSRTAKGRADNYMYIDDRMAYILQQLIELARQNGEIATTASTEDLVWNSYALIRGVNLKWCFRFGETDLLGDARNALNTLFLPKAEFAV